MNGDLKSAADFLLLNKRILSVGGMWPLSRTFIHFYINYIYMLVHLTLAFTDFISIYGNMHLMMENLLETSIQTMLCFKMIVIRQSPTLRQILRRVEEGTHENNYRDDTEKQLYLAHNVIGQTFFKAGHYLAFVTGVIYYLGPLKDCLTAAMNNETQPYVLPFRTHLFLDIQNVRNYVLMYIWQLPLFYYGYCHAITVGFLCTLVFHVTGKMSVLAHRIRLIGSTSDLLIHHDNPDMTFREIVKKHLHVMWEASAIDDVFNLLLLEELIITTILIALVAYNLLSPVVPFYDKLFLGNYCVALLAIILIYCLTGDSLIRQSENIHDAFYECPWYQMKPKHQKNLIICMVRSQQPVHLTAGRFYIFSLPRFSEILKTAMAYISMLRTVV
uniref:Odorant receptor n=1 Tax=Campoletis chlorideae TaxID=219166 RepID=A0A346D418_9HYME|nr:odorant receptor [Campoletis chlorideae]